LLGNYNGRELILAIASRLEKTKEQVEVFVPIAPVEGFIIKLREIKGYDYILKRNCCA
jgi:hypothetical protein